MVHTIEWIAKHKEGTGAGEADPASVNLDEKIDPGFNPETSLNATRQAAAATAGGAARNKHCAGFSHQDLEPGGARPYFNLGYWGGSR